MPGMENLEPDRTDTSSGLSTSPNLNLPTRVLHLLHVLAHLRIETVRNALPELIEQVADLGGDGEPRRDRHARVRHLSEARALASEQVLHRPCPVSLAFAEKINILFSLCHRTILPGKYESS